MIQYTFPFYVNTICTTTWTGEGDCYGKTWYEAGKDGKGHDRPHLLDAQLTHWLVRLSPLPVLEVLSELRTDSASMLFASVDSDERRGELGTDGGWGIEGERDISVVDLPEVAVVMVGGEESAEEEEEKEEDGDEGVVVGCAVGFKNCPWAFFALAINEVNPSLIALFPTIPASLEWV